MGGKRTFLVALNVGSKPSLVSHVARWTSNIHITCISFAIDIGKGQQIHIGSSTTSFDVETDLKHIIIIGGKATFEHLHVYETESPLQYAAAARKNPLPTVFSPL